MAKRRLWGLILSICFILAAAQAAYALPAVPKIDGEAYMLIEMSEGQVLAERNVDERLYMASLTKVMTAYVVLNSVDDLTQQVSAPADFANVGESHIGIKPKETHSYLDLLYALLVRSANDAAQVLAIGVAGSEPLFVQMMNETAAALGMDGTHFTNPHGLHNEQHYSTARDMITLARAALENDVFRQIVGTDKIELRWNDEPLVMNSTNKLFGSYTGIKGVKTGFTTPAGNCLIALAERNGMELLAVLLKSSQAFDNMPLLLDYGFDNFEWRQLYVMDESFGTLPVTEGKQSETPLYLPQGLRLLCLRGEESPQAEVFLPESIAAPVALAEKVGGLTLTDCFGTVHTLDICSEAEVKRHTFLLSFRDVFATIFSLFTRRPAAESSCRDLLVQTLYEHGGENFAAAAQGWRGVGLHGALPGLHS